VGQESTRSARIEARIAPDALRIVRRAAELQGRSVSDFVVDSALNMARKAIEETDIVRLAVEDQRAVAEAIFNPPPLTPGMERAIDRYKGLIKSSR
jgi:uncharacterized protein (DUF1778 family)